MFTVLFAVARTVGWVAQWAEMAAQQQSAPKISRPRQARVPAPETLSGRRSKAATRKPQAMADVGDAACFLCTAEVLVLCRTPSPCPRDFTRCKQLGQFQSSTCACPRASLGTSCSLQSRHLTSGAGGCVRADVHGLHAARV